MIEAAFVFVLFLMQIKLWWLLAVCLLMNRLFNRPLALLAVFSPIYWFIEYQSNEFPLIMQNLSSSYGLAEGIGYFFVTFAMSFVLYRASLELYKKFCPSAKYPLSAALLVYLVTYAIHAFFETIGPKFLNIAWTGVFFFFGNVFVMLAYEFKDSTDLQTVKPWKRFLMLHTVHEATFNSPFTQLAPRGLKSLFYSPHSKKRNLKVDGFKILVICFFVKIMANALGHLFLGDHKAYLTTAGVPAYDLVQITVVHTLPWYFSLHSEVTRPELYTLFFIRVFHWFALRYVYINTSISFLLLMGFSVKLGVLNPFRSISLADFYRRAHVYVAEFYKTFLYAEISAHLRWIKSHQIRKYLSIWIMLFFGGVVFQTFSHSYQLDSWSFAEFCSVFEERVVYYLILSSEVTLSLYFERRSRRRPAWETFIRSILYLFIYGFLMSWAASYKQKGFYLADFLQYLEFMTGLK